MSKNTYQLFLYRDNKNIEVGSLNFKESQCCFSYCQSYLKNPQAIALCPSLPLVEKVFTYKNSLPNILEDTIGGRWCDELGEQKTLKLSPQEKLLHAQDYSRMGALRIKKEGHFIAGKKFPTVNIKDLKKMQDLLQRFFKKEESIQEWGYLHAESLSMGGIDPKINAVDDKEQLYVAKFPHIEEGLSARRWEAFALYMAQQAGLVTVKWELLEDILLMERFDRKGAKRFHYISAHSAMALKDGEDGSYIQAATFIKRHSHSPEQDLKNLWKRVVLKALLSSHDDHSRNYGFLLKEKGWELSPLYDFIPIPEALISRKNLGCLQDILPLSLHFELDKKQAYQLIKEAAQPLKDWRQVAKNMLIKNHEITLMASAIEHQDLSFALGI